MNLIQKAFEILQAQNHCDLLSNGNRPTSLDEFVEWLEIAHEQGVNGSKFSWFWMTFEVLKNEQFLSKSQVIAWLKSFENTNDEVLWLERLQQSHLAREFFNTLDKDEYEQFGDFHFYLWEQVAEMATCGEVA